MEKRVVAALKAGVLYVDATAVEIQEGGRADKIRSHVTL